MSSREYLLVTTRHAGGPDQPYDTPATRTRRFGPQRFGPRRFGPKPRDVLSGPETRLPDLLAFALPAETGRVGPTGRIKACRNNSYSES